MSPSADHWLLPLRGLLPGRDSGALRWMPGDFIPKAGDLVYWWNLDSPTGLLGWGSINIVPRHKRYRGPSDGAEAFIFTYSRSDPGEQLQIVPTTSLSAPLPIPSLDTCLPARPDARYMGGELDHIESPRRLTAVHVEMISGAISASAQPESTRLHLVSPDLLDAVTLHPQLLRTLDWRVFEYLLAEVLSRAGYEIELQRGTKDGGVDLFAIRQDPHLGPHRYLLQAKRYRDAVGVEPVQRLLFLHEHHRMTKSCLATTSRFTAGAWELANQYRWQLSLRDFESLRQWLVDMRLAPP